jgi:hypothetical protein
MDASAAAAYRYNRIGFCVLHPATAAGRPYRATTAEGQMDGMLPTFIAPQSIVDGVEIALFPACSTLAIDLEDATVTTVFEGDLFEMEDQRNWTDGSFKTYCTPIALGYPHSARARQVLRQRVDVSVSTPLAVVPRRPGAPEADAPLVVWIAQPEARGWPRIGLGIPAGEADRRLPLGVVRSLAQAGLDHLRLDLHLSDPDWADRLDRARQDVSSIGRGR